LACRLVWWSAWSVSPEPTAPIPDHKAEWPSKTAYGAFAPPTPWVGRMNGKR